jgi:hypothetical protein
MSQREPLSPPLLTAAAIVAAFPALWIALAVDVLVAGAVGALAGFPWSGLAISPSFTLRPLQGLEGEHPATLWVLVLLAGPLGSAALGFGVHRLVEAVRSPAWLRIAALEWVAIALLRLPTLLVAGVAPGGHGPLDEIYVRLGEPQAGRWSLGLLALLALAAVAAAVARLTVAAGQGWMRIDGREFRRRLVRALAGIPAVVALAAWSAVMPWAGTLVMAGWLVLTLAALTVLVS